MRYVECLLQMFFGWVCRILQHLDNRIGKVWLDSKHDVEQLSNDQLISTLKSSICFFVWIRSQVIPSMKRDRNRFAIFLTKSFNNFSHIVDLVQSDDLLLMIFCNPYV